MFILCIWHKKFSITNARVGKPLCRSENGAGLRISACTSQKNLYTLTHNTNPRQQPIIVPVPKPKPLELVNNRSPKPNPLELINNRSPKPKPSSSSTTDHRNPNPSSTIDYLNPTPRYLLLATYSDDEKTTIIKFPDEDVRLI